MSVKYNRLISVFDSSWNRGQSKTSESLNQVTKTVLELEISYSVINAQPGMLKIFISMIITNNSLNRTGDEKG